MQSNNSFYLRHTLLSVRINITYPVFTNDGILWLSVIAVWFVVSLFPSRHTHIHTYIHISFHLMKKTIRPAEFAAVTTVDVTLLLGCDAVKFGIVKACAVAIFRGGWVCGWCEAFVPLGCLLRRKVKPPCSDGVRALMILWMVPWR